MKIYAPWEKVFKKVLTPFEYFLKAQTTTGVILLCMTILALILANSPLSTLYNDAFHIKIDFNVGSWKISNTLHHWINDGLMAIFFFLIGLEIKREVSTGKLSDIRVALLPILAAIGGMIFPAVIFFGFNYGTPSANGWAIPMATDIAFAISVLVLLGRRVPPALIAFLVALAIVDDLGAILVIAIFYTATINTTALILSAILFLFMILLNRFGVHKILPYFVLGILMWFFMLESGIHATLAGVIAALAIPSVPKRHPSTFVSKTKQLLSEYDDYTVDINQPTNEKQKSILTKLKETINDFGTPASRLEHGLHMPVALIVIPIFALANAGISIDFSSFFSTITTSVSIGIIVGLILGKVIGIFGVSWLVIKLKIASLPQGSSLSQIFGVAFLGGIGFTMSIFVADLAFVDSPEMILQSKSAILVASLVAGLFGYVWLRYIAKSK